MLEELKKKVYQANLDLVKHGLVIFTWGNVSGIDREKNLVVIKPSGVSYKKMTVEDMVVTDMSGKVVEGELRPSVDLPTHLELYKRYTELGAVAHTHSKFATAYAQAGRSITAYGTTQADYFYGDIPCSRKLSKEEVEHNYEANTGKVIIEKLGDCDVLATPACLVGSHGVFSWGDTADKAVYNAVVVEQCAQMAMMTEQINPSVSRVDQYLLDKHYFRKHGANATYGQTKPKK